MHRRFAAGNKFVHNYKFERINSPHNKSTLNYSVLARGHGLGQLGLRTCSLCIHRPSRHFSDRGTFADAIVGSNPMFPQRPIPPPPPPPPGGNSAGAGKDGFHPDFEESFLSKHSGYIGIFALIFTTSAVTSYYKSYRARIAKVEEVELRQFVEPREVSKATQSHNEDEDGEMQVYYIPLHAFISGNVCVCACNDD
jgi:hypothetical protein